VSLEGEPQASNTLSSDFRHIIFSIVRQTLASSDSIFVMHISHYISIATVALIFSSTAAPTSHLVARNPALDAANSYYQCTSNAKREATVEKREAALNACRFEATAEKREAEPESLEALMEKRDAALDAANSYYQCTSNAKREATVEKREAALNACRFEATAEKREAEPESLEALMEKRDAALDAANSYSQIICARDPALNACKYAATEKTKREAAAHGE